MNFSYKVSVEVPMSLLEVEFLQKMAAIHYDSHCKSVGAPGGFLYGMRNSAAFSEEDGEPAKHFLLFRQIDTLLKILEPTAAESFDGGRTMRVALRDRLFPCLQAINDELARLGAK